MIEGKQRWIKSWRKTEVITANLHVKPIQLLKTEHTQSNVHKPRSPVQYLHMCKGNEHQKSKVKNPDQALVWQTPLDQKRLPKHPHERFESQRKQRKRRPSVVILILWYCWLYQKHSTAGSRDAVHLNHILCQWGVWVQYQWGHSSVEMTADVIRTMPENKAIRAKNMGEMNGGAVS